ncbi:MAG: S-methyl-5-thioribose-1-phosphate isomerase [Deltaproteobacteria bacterium]|nr:S-methyl-5-thioribose-1-phosphate isomerase [Deltaproteobacteria bacterium]
MVSSCRYQEGVLHLLDQRQLPGSEVWVACTSVDSVAHAIETMVVRGAPAIANAAVLALAGSAVRRARERGSWRDDLGVFELELTRLGATRPTAVNLFTALNVMRDLAAKFTLETPRHEVAAKLEAAAHRIVAGDVSTCEAIEQYGLSWVRQQRFGKKLRILTHCNTGALATAGSGTALGIIRALWAAELLSLVYVDETRPYLQGSRLTAYELEREGIPFRLNCDSAAAVLMQRGEVDLVCVGADRIVANGDTANKIGTYNLAVQAHFHQVPFVVAAPTTTFDLQLNDGKAIAIEDRSPEELRQIAGIRIAPPAAPVFNPSFDVTPAALITAIVTDRGWIAPVRATEIRKVLAATAVCS